jgi:hypothetical protein
MAARLVAVLLCQIVYSRCWFQAVLVLQNFRMAPLSEFLLLCNPHSSVSSNRAMLEKV